MDSNDFANAVHEYFDTHWRKTHLEQGITTYHVLCEYPGMYFVLGSHYGNYHVYLGKFRVESNTYILSTPELNDYTFEGFYSGYTLYRWKRDE